MNRSELFYSNAKLLNDFGYNICIFLLLFLLLIFILFLLLLAIPIRTRFNALALVVNTNEKTTAATALMSIFFALKFFVVIILIF